MDVQYDRSNAKLDAWAEQHGVPQIIVATGFIAKNPKVQLWSSGLPSVFVGPDLAGAVLLCRLCTSHTALDCEPYDGKLVQLKLFFVPPRRNARAKCLRTGLLAQPHWCIAMC